MTPLQIWCVGRNYRAHAQELGNAVPDKPLIFLKGGACAVSDAAIALPTWTDDIHHECEIAVRVNAQGKPTHFGLALDLTARAVQSELKKKGEPWTLAKSFRGACPVSRMIPFESYAHFAGLEFQLVKNGQVAQKGRTRDMIFELPTLLDHVQRFFPVAEGDLVLTGTPEGVGPVKSGDVLKAEISSDSPILSVTWAVK